MSRLTVVIGVVGLLVASLLVLPSEGVESVPPPVNYQGEQLCSAALLARTHSEQQQCYRQCVNRCWLRWRGGGLGDRASRYRQYRLCVNSCMWSCG